MKLSKTRKIAVLSLTAVMASSLAFNGLVGIGKGGNARLAEASSASPSTSTSAQTTKGVTFKEVDGIDTSSIFSEYYNPDVVKVNDIKESENRVAIVNLNSKSLMDYAEAAGKTYSEYAATKTAEQDAKVIEKSINAFKSSLFYNGIDAEILYTYNTLTTGVAVRAKGSALNAIAKLDGVNSVVLSESYAAPKVIEISNDTNVYSTGIYNTSEVDPALRGDGMLIAVLDTGMDVQHDAFQENNFKAKQFKLTKSAVQNNLGKLRATQLSASATAETLYKSSKLPFAFDYADKDTNVYPSYSSHGVHVSGIIAGNRTDISQDIVNSDDDLKFDYDNEKQTHYFEGVVPDAQIATFKVFTDNIDEEGLGGADTEDILAALEDAVTIGVDVINMSLGSSGGFSSYADEFMSYVYNRIENAGVSLVCAASNDYSSGFGGENGTNLTSNPDSATVGSPSTYPASISVASINGQKDPYMVANSGSDSEAMIFFTEATDGNSNKMDFVENIFTKLKKAGQMAADATRVELDYVVIPGLGRSYNYTESIKQQLKSKPTIALVQRGTTTFEEKMKIAKENGAVAIMIYNNVAGTISMTMGAKDLNEIIPSCSISMDTGNKLVLGATNSLGKIVLDKANLSGPFMSEFSSWGPTPSLSLKPEITAYGGNVTSAVAGGYDVYSGTSMASPNMAGAVAIIRQSLKNAHPDWTPKQIHDRTYQMMMSTAGIVLDSTGTPYSPRKQGSGIADIDASLTTQSYMYVKDSQGKVSSKTKIELFDDPQKKGEYSFTFYVENISTEYAQYSAKYYVMTETVSSDGKTVAEKGLILNDAEVKISVNGKQNTRVGINGGDTAEIKVEITLSEANKKYLDDNFKNGIYVEGFIVLEQTLADGNNVKRDLSIPFLAFYGDWTDAPILDYSSFEIAENQADDSIPDEDKLKIDFWSTTPYSKYGEKYILPLGQYLYKISDDMEKLYASEDKAAISMYNETLHSTAYQFYAVYAGLLRGMAVCNAKIVNEYTGEIIWQDTLTNVAKGYANGGSTRPGFIKIEFDPYAMNLPGNTKFHFYMEGYLDYGDGQQGNKNSFDFSFYTDYEAPTLVGVDLRYEDYVDANEETHTRIYLDVTTYDNLYTQAILPLYVNEDNTMLLLQQYIVPVYSDVKGSTVTTAIEITDYYEDYFDNIRIQVEDYAMNFRTYSLDLSEAIASTFPEKIAFSEEEHEMAAGEAYKPAFTVTPDTAQHYDLVWRSSNEAVVRVDKGEIFAVGAGEAYVTVYGTNTNIGTVDAASARIKIIVKEGTASARYTQPEFGLIYNASKTPVNPTNSTVEVDPNEYIQLTVRSNPWYLPQAKFNWSSQNNLVATVDENGLVHTLKEGTAIITAEQEGTNGVLSVSVTLSVGPEFVISSYVLTEYHGVGGDVVVPDELNFMYIDEECFMDNTTITSFIVPDDVTEIREKAFYGCTALKYISFPKSLTLVGNSAFEGCTSLETIDMTHSLSVIFSHRCFYGCTSLKEIVNDERLTAVWDYTFAGCTSLKELNVSKLVQAGKYSFANCTGLEKITTSRYTEIGEGMFFGCTGLKKLELPVEYVGKDAFYACGNLTELALTGHCVLDEGAFRECSALNMLYFAGDVYEIGDRAFEGCKSLVILVLPDNEVTIGENAFSRCNGLRTLGLQPDTLLNSPQAFRNCGSWENVLVAEVTGDADSGYDLKLGGELNNYSISGRILYNKSETEIVLIPKDISSEDFTLPSTLEKIGDGAFYGLTKLTSVTIPEGVKEIGDFAFSYSCITSVNIPASVNKLGTGAFAYCYDLSEVTFAAGSALREIPEGCFNTTFELKKVTLPSSVEVIGAYAFGESGVNTLYAAGSAMKEGLFDGSGFPSLKTIGENAFASTMFEKVELSQSLKVLSNYSFALCPELEEVTFNSNVIMGDFVFFDSTHLTKVKFFDTMKDIGNFTFTSTSGQPSLTNVILPAYLEVIGHYAFWNCSALSEITIPSGVRTIGVYAFYKCSSLENIDLSRVEYIGESAFAETASLTSAKLERASYIGDYAFYQSGLEEVTVPVLQELGAGGLAFTNITKIDLPATLKKVGSGSLHYNFYLTGISLGGEAGKNDNFFIDELEEKNYGVLYSYLPDGSYQAEAYPGGSPAKEYHILEGTSRIGEMAFTGAIGLNEVYCPVTLVTIGDKGFYDCRADYYEFASFTAPNLEARYINGADYGSDEWLNIIFDRNGENSDERYYANFYYYAMYSVYAEYDFGLSLVYPSNASGYNEYIWKVFFSDMYSGKETIEDNTLNSIKALMKIDTERLKALQSAEASDMQAKAEVEGYALLLKQAYGYYSNITSDTQMDFFTGKYDETDYSAELKNIQGLMSVLKNKFGIISEIIKLSIKSMPAKTTYALNEKIDTTGMVVEAVYDDGSTGAITDYTLDRDTANVLGRLRVTITAGGKTVPFYITVQEGTDIPPEIKPEPDGNSLLAVYIAVPVAAAAAAAAVASVLIIRNKKKKASLSGNGSAESQEKGDSEGN